MAGALVSDNAASTLRLPFFVSDTTMHLGTGQGFLFPSPRAPWGEWGIITVSDANGVTEVMTYNSRVGDDLTGVSRDPATTSPANFNIGDKVELRMTASHYSAFPMMGFTPRFKWTINKNLYVRTDGDDTNNGWANVGGASSTASAAFLTIQRAINEAAGYDLNGFSVTINIAAGTYTPTLTAKSAVGGGSITLLGGAGVIASNFTATDVTTPYVLTDIQWTNSTPGNRVTADRSRITISGSNTTFGAAASFQIQATNDARISLNASYTVSGGGARHLYAQFGSIIDAPVGITVTLTGTPAFTSEFAKCTANASMSVGQITYSGAATGTRYLADLNGTINTISGGANFFPGNAAGSTATGGQYV